MSCDLGVSLKGGVSCPQVRCGEMLVFVAQNLEKKLSGNGHSALSVCSASAKAIVARDDMSVQHVAIQPVFSVAQPAELSCYTCY